MGVFTLRTVKTGNKFDLRAGNGQIILTSEVYSSRAACVRGAESVRKCAASAPVLDLTDPDGVSLPNPRFEVYCDRSGNYRFRMKARNGKIIAVSEAYSGKANCLKGIDSVRTNAPDAAIEYTE